MTDAAKTKSVMVRATAAGFHVGRRRVGDEFEYAARLNDKGEPVLGSWMVLVSDAPEPKAKAKAKAKGEPSAKDESPRTFSEGAKSTGADLV